MAGFGFMNRFYYGKAGQADYTPDKLPANRRALFFEMLRIRFAGIMGVNLLYLAFLLPALVWSLYNVSLLYYLTEQGGNFIQEGYLFVYLLFLIPCLGIAGIGATGEMYILRNWARDQHAFMASDFKDAVKGNWKNGLIVGLINGFSLFLGFVCYNFYGQMASTSFLYTIPQMLSLALVLVWWMMNIVIYPMMVTYDMKLGHLLRNSAILSMARLPWSFLFLLGTVGVPAALIFVPYGVVIVAVLYLLVGFGLTGFLYASYANACFDKYLNPRIPGAKVNMGLREETDEDDDDIQDDHPLI